MSYIDLSINPQTEADKITSFLKRTFLEEGFDRAVIATSGGIDSTTSLFLATRALGKENVYPVILPYGKMSKEAKEDALLAIKMLNIPSQNIHIVDISPMVDSLAANLALTDKDSIRKGNIMARIRMITLYDIAKKLKSLVVGTENKSEDLLGYFTRFGDEASDIEPIRHLYKTQVYELAKHLDVPEKIIDKAPTAGLWPGQTDETEFGFSYRDADQILSAHYDHNLSNAQIIKLGIPEDLITKVYLWVKKMDFKHKLPFTLTDKVCR